ncbi:MAG: hypothetical protein JO048_04375 [Methylobacteriaceae bacterium]|nr:hypothetical protein [Methylobacteriaceae bacterium]
MSEKRGGAAGASRPEDRPARDFGDSAGYGTGGSALDRHEVEGETPPQGEGEALARRVFPDGPKPPAERG